MENYVFKLGKTWEYQAGMENQDFFISKIIGVLSKHGNLGFSMSKKIEGKVNQVTINESKYRSIQ